MEFSEAEGICRRNVCGAVTNKKVGGKLEVWGQVHEVKFVENFCENVLVPAWGGDGYEVRCADHGYNPPLRKLKSYTRKYRDGEPIPLHVLNQIEKKIKREEKDGKGRAGHNH